MQPSSARRESGGPRGIANQPARSAQSSLLRPAPRWPQPRSPAAPGRPLPPACELGSRALSAGAAAGNSSVLMTMAAGSGVRLSCPSSPPRH